MRILSGISCWPPFKKYGILAIFCSSDDHGLSLGKYTGERCVLDGESCELKWAFIISLAIEHLNSLLIWRKFPVVWVLVSTRALIPPSKIQLARYSLFPTPAVRAWAWKPGWANQNWECESFKWVRMVKVCSQQPAGPAVSLPVVGSAVLSCPNLDVTLLWFLLSDCPWFLPGFWAWFFSLPVDSMSYLIFCQ